jgi:hypothetical protein
MEENKSTARVLHTTHHTRTSLTLTLSGSSPFLSFSVEPCGQAPRFDVVLPKLVQLAARRRSPKPALPAPCSCVGSEPMAPCGLLCRCVKPNPSMGVGHRGKPAALIASTVGFVQTLLQGRRSRSPNRRGRWAAEPELPSAVLGQRRSTPLMHRNTWCWYVSPLAPLSSPLCIWSSFLADKMCWFWILLLEILEC